MVPRTGLEPACLSTHAPETCASTIPPPGHLLSATLFFFAERKTRLELATLTLARLCSTNWAISASFLQPFIIFPDCECKGSRFFEKSDIFLQRPHEPSCASGGFRMQKNLKMKTSEDFCREKEELRRSLKNVKAFEGKRLRVFLQTPKSFDWNA